MRLTILLLSIAMVIFITGCSIINIHNIPNVSLDVQFVPMNTPADSVETFEQVFKRLEKDAEHNRQFLPVYAIMLKQLDINNNFGMPPEVIQSARKLDPGWTSYQYIGSTEVNIHHNLSFIVFDTGITISSSTGENSAYIERRSDPVESMIDYIREVRSKGLLFIKDSTAIKTAIPSLLFTDINFYKVMWRYHIDTNYLKPVKDVDYRKLESEFFSMLFAETDGVLTRNAIEKWFAKLDKPINQLIKNSGQPYGYITYQNGKYQLENPQ